MNVTLLDLDNATGRSIQARPADKHGDVFVPFTETREVVVGRNVDPQPDETPYVAFWALTDSDAGREEHDQLFEGMNRLERLKAIIFGGATVEPELATEVVNLDGVSVVQVDLHPHVPHHILMIPERFLP